ncbi:hypothetical protein M768_09515 [Cellulosimicrobium cellulans F16]|uniref:Uncharacterized protein n=1 Tax=Cellulosimicrobium cellulans F16 TaxID=1350482 RepID=A0A0M0F708_CELCE|nr:hypothetical protein [Cellulosimicrobium cellulans]KON73172.1 hypothetical protein M768_09515 [Cellulosimicrobium cellulans F16]
MIDTVTAPDRTISREHRGPRVPTPTYLSSGPQNSVDAAMAALSDAVERTLQEDLAQGMVPTVEQMSVSVVVRPVGSAEDFTAVALLLISYAHTS